MTDLQMMYVVRIDGDDSDPDYTGVTKIATATGYEWRIVGPLAEALKHREDEWRCRRVALEADAASARKGASVNYDRAMEAENQRGDCSEMTDINALIEQLRLRAKFRDDYAAPFDPNLDNAAADEIERLRSSIPTEDELDNAESEGYEQGYADGQNDCQGAYADLWSMLLSHIKKHDCEPASDDGYSHNAGQMMDAVFEREANLRNETERLRAELAGQRMCVNCGKFAPDDHDRTQPLPECVGPDDMAACTFDLTPSEAWQHWSKIAHDLRADNARLRANIEELKA